MESASARMRLNGACMATCTAQEYFDTLMQMPDLQFVAGFLATKHFEPFSLDQLSAMLKRYSSLTMRPRAKQKPRPPESVFVVYWITLKDATDVPLYVGVTNSPAKRWSQHRNNSLQLLRVKDRSQITMNVVETIVGTHAEALAAESRHILAAFAINPDLYNRTNPLKGTGGDK
jgi:predicted GIY-YIG superfamily endonuclease